MNFSATALLVLFLVAAVAAPFVAAVVARPQRGVLLLASLVPFNGLLLLVPNGATAGPWKEALVLFVLGATFVAPKSARGPCGDRVPSWIGAVVAYAALGVAGAVLTGGLAGLWGLKIGYFYLILPVILWRCPLTRSDRDRLVTVLMATGAITVAVGLAQQVFGAERLNAMGYDYNATIRFAGGLLRSFSTFDQPFPFGLFVAMVLLVALPTALTDPRRPRNTLFLAASPLLVLGMATSVVRGAFLALAVGLIILMLRRHHILLHALVPAVVAIAFLPPTVLSAFVSSNSLDQRATGWQTVAERINLAPWGSGLGRVGAAAEKALQEGADPSQVLLAGSNAYQPDNQFVKAVLELGVVGLWLLLLVLVTVAVSALRASNAASLDGRADDKAFAEGIAASVGGVVAASVVSTYLEIFPLDFYFWLFVGVILCFDRTSNSTPSPSARAAAASRRISVSSSVR